MSVQSDSESDSATESIDTVLSELKAQMAQIDALSSTLTAHVTDLFQRTKQETTDWMKEPLRPRQHLEAWCAEHGLPVTPTLDEFIDACFTAARSMDLETRIATFKKEDAEVLWKGRRRISVFEILSSIPTLFH
jgi:uncharacterized protein YcaQ